MKVVLTSMLVLLLAACASPGVAPVGDAPATTIEIPVDRLLDVVVVAGEDAAEATQAHLRPSRYVLFPDGSLHYGDAAADEFARGTEWLPPRTRVLSSGQIRSVWTLADELGFTDPEAGAPPRNLSLLEPAPGGITYMVSVAGAGVYRLFVRPPQGGEADEAAAQLTRRLAALAWADDRRWEPLAADPKRYDLGSDPYARYRKP